MELKSISVYLSELREFLRGRVPEQQLEAILAETEGHIREGAEELEPSGGRLAEHVAVEQFGDASKIARQLLKPEPKPYWRAALVPMLVVFLFPVCAITAVFAKSYGWEQGYLGVLFVCVPVALAVTFTASCYFAKRLMLTAVGFATALSCLFAVLFCCYAFVAASPETGHSIIPRSMVAAYESNEADQKAKLVAWRRLCVAAQEANLDPMIMYFALRDPAWQERAMNELKTRGGYVVPLMLTRATRNGLDVYDLKTAVVRTREEGMSLIEGKEIRHHDTSVRGQQSPYDFHFEETPGTGWSLGSVERAIEEALEEFKQAPQFGASVSIPPLKQARGFASSLGYAPLAFLAGLWFLNLLGYLAHLVFSARTWPRRRYT